MRCNWRRWLWGIIPLLLLSWVAIQAEHGRLEKDLAERSRYALSQSGLIWAMAEFKGRDAVLTGRAPIEGEPSKAAEALAQVWGVRVIDNRAGLLDKADKYIWIASRRHNRIRLSGFAPSLNARQAILGVTKVSFPGFEVVDRTKLARGAPSTDVWLAGVSFALKQLASISRGEVRLEDLALSVRGEAEDVAAYRGVKSALAGGLPKGIKVVVEHVTAPAVSPYTWSAKVAEGQLVLSGYVPSEAARAELLAAAKAGFPNAAVADRMQPGEGAPQGWAAAAAASLRELPRLQGGSAEMKDAVLVISGMAEDEAAAEASRKALRAVLPATIKLSDQIRVKEPPPPPPPPAVVAPPVPSGPPMKEAEPAAPPGKADAIAAQTPNTTGSIPPPAASAAEVQAKACEQHLRELAGAGQIRFHIASAELETASFETLDKLAQAAKACPGTRIEVAGHASSEGNAELNQALSLRRAQSVVAYLVQAGVETTQLEPVGYGSNRPVAPNDSDENLAKNRRIEFAVRPN
jgi:OOP family OmpA-OmpF porin